LIKDVDSGAEISMHSTYGYNDTRLETDHIIIREYATKLFPAIFPEPLIPFGLKIDKLRILTFIISLIKSLLILISKNKIYLKLLLTDAEFKAVKDILSSDVIISKGGSFLVTENSSIRQTISLIRMIYPFILAKRYDKKIVIFSQSLGPVEGKLSQWIFEKVLSKIDFIYLRESLCLDKYESVQKVCDIVDYEIIPDSAFYLKSDDDTLPINIDSTKFNVGFTLVDHDFKYIKSQNEVSTKRKNYKQSIVESMKYLVDTHQAIIHIFPQVICQLSLEEIYV